MGCSSTGGMIIGGRGSAGGKGSGSVVTDMDFLRRLKKPDGFFCRPCEEVCREGELPADLVRVDCSGDDAFVGYREAETAVVELLDIVLAIGAGELDDDSTEKTEVAIVDCSELVLEPPPNIRLKKPCFSFGCKPD